ncbi:MAG: hypothetical protein GKR90_14125 [Pseudomonadales bacterium]|nr:hypothetical protein [Pseudomonadales bacterium]
MLNVNCKNVIARRNRSKISVFIRLVTSLVFALGAVPALASESATVISTGDVVFYTLTLATVVFFSVGMIVSRELHWLTYSVYGFLAITLVASIDGTLAHLFNDPWYRTDGPLIAGAMTAAFGFWHVAFRIEDGHWLAHTRWLNLSFAVLMAILIPTYFLFVEATPSLLVPLYSTLNTGMLLMFTAQIFPPITWTEFSTRQHRITIIWPLTTALVGAGGYVIHFAGPGFSIEMLELLNRVIFSMHLLHLLVFVCISVLVHIRARIEAEQEAADAARQAAEAALALERSERNFERARAVASERSRQLASASHDLKQPITALRQVIERRSAEAEGRDMQRLRDAVDYLDQLTGTFLDEGNKAIDDALESEDDHRELDQDELAREAVGVNVILNTVTALFQEEAAQSGMTIGADASDEVIRVQPLALTRAVSNLVSNAIAHSDGKSIRLRAIKQEDGLCIDVTDNGRGMTAEEADQATKLRYKGEHSTGSGLGLAIVQAQADEQDWIFSLQTDPRQGLTARLLIPNS